MLNVLVFAVWPFLFVKSKKTLRHTLNYAYLGCLFVFSNILGATYSIRLSPSIQISGGNIAYAAIVMTTLFMVIIERDLAIIRNVVISVSILSGIFFLLYQMIYIFLQDSNIVNPLNISPLLFEMSINIVIAGTILIILELTLMGVLFEKIKIYVKNYELTSLIYLAVFIFILILDGIFFPIFAFALDPNLAKMIIGGFQGKLILGIFFSIPILIFMIFNHKKLTQYIEQPLSIKNLFFWTKKELVQQVEESEKKYQEAYNQAEFYKDLFFHDINNMLQNIKASIDLITLYQNKFESAVQISKCAIIINEQVIKGGNMVSNIRKLSKLGESKKTLERFEVIHALKEAVQFVNKSYLAKTIDIKIQSQIDEIFVQANEFLLNIFENILINAVIHNENPKIEILIEISKEVKNDINYVKIETKDNGIGIPDDLKKIIFKKEIINEDRSKRMGLGLLLVNKLVSSYDGKIWVEDKVPGDYSKGSKFVILLPEVK